MFPFPTPLLAAGQSAGGGGGVTAKYAYTEDNSTITESAGSFTDLLSYTSSGLTNGKTHLGIWTCEGVVNSTSPTIETLLQIDGVDGLTEIRKSKSSVNVFSFGGLFLHTPAGSSTFKIRGRQSATNTASFNNRRLTLLELDADEYSMSSIARQTKASTTLASVATLTFTPTTPGDYVALVSFLIDINSSSRHPVFSLDDGTTTTGPITTEFSTVTTCKYPWLLALPLGTVSGSKTVTLKLGINVTSATAGISNIVMVALRQNRFTNAAVTRLAADDSSSSTSYTPVVSQVFTANAGPHLAIGGWGMIDSLSTATIFHKMIDGGTDISNQQEVTFGTPGTTAGFTHRIATYSAGSHTNEIDRSIGIGTSTITTVAGSGIVTLQL